MNLADKSDEERSLYSLLGHDLLEFQLRRTPNHALSSAKMDQEVPVEPALIEYDEYRTPEAWACWDAARELWPGRPIQLGIDAFEHKMLTEHPEFF